jgi:hypothetical protein
LPERDGARLVTFQRITVPSRLAKPGYVRRGECQRVDDGTSGEV